jgi:hypothetical protein
VSKNLPIKIFVLAIFLVNLTELNRDKATAALDSSLVIKKENFRKSTSGYTNQTSNFVGDSIAFKTTCPTRTFYIEAIRIGFYNGKEGKVINTSKNMDCVNQLSSSTSEWRTTALIETSNFPHGMYLFRIVDDQKYASFIPVVLREKSSQAKAVFSIPTMTMQAYNTWTGADTYGADGNFDKRLRIIDFKKPYDKNFGTGKYFQYVHPLVVYAEELNLDVTYVADTDLHFEKDLLKNKKVLISAGHDEYWTKQERDNVLSARKFGTNTLFFGANAGYWNTRLSKSPIDGSLKMEIYKSSSEDPSKVNKTVKFRDIGKPESELTGLEYKCFPAKGDLKVKAPKLFVFSGLGNLNNLSLGQIVGPEVDTLKKDNYFDGSIVNLADSRVRCGTKWYVPRYGTMNMILGYSKNGGGGLFSTGTMGWVTKGLTVSQESDIGKFTRVVTKNVLERSIVGPLSSD